MTKLKRLATSLTAAVVALTAMLASAPQMLAKTVAADDASTRAVTAVKPDAGDGSSEKPFEIDSAEEMWWFAGYVNGSLNSADDENGQKHVSACAKLTGDFDLKSSDQTPWKYIGGNSDVNAFTGTFDGNGHTIEGFVNNNVSGRDYYGLFATNKGTIKNLTLHGNLGKGWFIGGIAAYNSGTIDNCTYMGTLFGLFGAGGIVGVNSTNGRIIHCINKAAISGATSLGGIAGLNSSDSEVSDCINGGTVNGQNSVGGIIGYNSGTLKNCYSVGSVNAVSRGDGGISGVASDDSTIENCYYLEGSVDEGRGGGINGKDEKGKAEVKSLTQFADGEVAWLLQDAHKEDTVWVQNIKADGDELANADMYPMFATKENSDKDKVYRVTLYFPDKDTVYGGAYANKGDYPNMPNNPSLSTGYEFAGWFSDEGCTQKFDPTSKFITEDTNAYGKGTPIQYTIKYNLNNGTYSNEESNPTEYNIESEDITLKNPKRAGYKFIGWSGTGLTGNTNTNVIIKKGSTGNREYYANFESDNPIGGEIKIGDKNVWGSFSEDITFNTYFKSAQDVSITYKSTEVEKDNVTVKYYISQTPIAEKDLDTVEWKDYQLGHTFEITEEGKYIIYAKLTDGTDNVEYVSSSGIIIDMTPPVISGIEDGKAYCKSQTVTVSDANFSYVSVNGTREASISSSGTFTLSSTTNNSHKTVVAYDKAGNTTTYNVTVNPSHSLGEVRTENEINNTCTEDGSYDIVGYCKLCGVQMYRKTEKTTATGHLFLKGWEEFTSPDCPGDGGRKRQCLRCKFTEVEYYENDGHDWEDTPTVDREPNCAREGSQSVHCKDCAAVKDSKVLPKTEHTKGAAVKVKEVAATCTAGGSYDSVVSCTVCGTELSRTHITTDPIEHIPGERVKDNNSVVLPTCDDDGRHDEVVSCTMCGAELERHTVVDPAHGHSFGPWEKFTSPDCPGDGGEQRTCDNCGLIEQRNVNPAGHNWKSEYTIDKAPTCTDEGSESIHCADCGAIQEGSSKTIAATGHKPEEAVTENVRPATCTSHGSYDEVVYCETCDSQISRTTVATDPIPHTPGTEVRTNEHHATCEADGSYDLVVYCTVCEAEVQRVTVNVPTSGHSFSEWEPVESSSCEGEGGERRTCTVCGYSETRNVSATGHEWDTDYIVDKAPTCTQEGSESIHCKKCDATKDSQTISPLGHTPGEAVIENEKAATCTASGSYDSVVYCTVCKEEISRVTEATDIASHKLTLVEYKAPTDDEDGYIEHYICDECSKLFADAEGTVELTAEEIIIPAGSIKSSIVGEISINGDDKSEPVEITITAGGQIVYEGTAEDGTYSIPTLNSGHYTVTFAKKHCAPRSYDIAIVDDILTLDAELKLYGDVNGDGELTTADVALANAHARQTRALVGYDFDVANVNTDDDITTLDCALINADVQGTNKLWQ